MATEVKETLILSGRCESNCSGKNSQNGRCTRNGSLRKIVGKLAASRAMICDYRAKKIVEDGYIVTLVRAES